MKSLCIGLSSLLLTVGISPLNQYFTEIEKRWHSNHQYEINYVIKDKQTWEEHYKKYHNDKVPNIDFSKEMVLGSYYGIKPNTGYQIEIKQIRSTDYALEILVEKTTPKPRHMYPEVITNSYHLVKTEKNDKEIFWIDEKK